MFWPVGVHVDDRMSDRPLRELTEDDSQTLATVFTTVTWWLIVPAIAVALLIVRLGDHRFDTACAKVAADRDGVEADGPAAARVRCGNQSKVH